MAGAGSVMLKDINKTHLKSFFGVEKPPEPSPEVYEVNLEKMLDWLSGGYIDRTLILPIRFTNTGTITMKAGDLEFKEVLGDISEEKKEISLEEILELQRQTIINEKIRRDGFFQNLEKQLLENDEEEK